MIPSFLEGPGGPVFTLRWPIASQVTARGAAILVPPFGEELNCSRRFLGVLARRLNGAGYEVMLPDLHGTGDSAGTFADADWALWRDEVTWLAAETAARTAVPITLIGLRTGALLAADVVHTAARRDAAGWACGLCCIQPVGDGNRFLDQLLRIRIARAMAHGETERRQDLRGRWQEGLSVHVGGYAVPAALATALASRRIADLRPPAGIDLTWITVIAHESAAPAKTSVPPPDWPPARAAVSVAAPAFWSAANLCGGEEVAEAVAQALQPALEVVS